MKWLCKSEKTVLENKIFKIVERKCESEVDHRKNDFAVMRSNDWCNVIPVTSDGKVVMVRQFRIGIDAFTLEIPGGLLDSTDSNPQEGAMRELAEETGFVAAPGARFENLGSIHPNPSFNDCRVHFYIVGPVEKKHDQNLDSGEMIETTEVEISLLESLMRDGSITHALVLNAFHFLRLKLGNHRPLEEILRRFTIPS